MKMLLWKGTRGIPSGMRMPQTSDTSAASSKEASFSSTGMSRSRATSLLLLAGGLPTSWVRLGVRKVQTSEFRTVRAKPKGKL